MESKNSVDDHYQFPFPESAIIEICKQYTHQKFKYYLSNVVVDRAMGCLFGSFIGDALGAYLQFSKQKDFQYLLKEVMQMPGGGIFKLKPGQVTDDSQLAFHLLHSLRNNFDMQGKFSESADQIILNIAKQYLNWGISRPFDIGLTCRKGIEVIKNTYQQYQWDKKNYTPAQLTKISKTLHSRVYQVNSSSQSNGSLMRIAPMPFFFSIINKGQSNILDQKIGLSKQMMKEFIKNQTGLLHANKTNVDVSYRWVSMLLAIIKRQDFSHLKDIYSHVVILLQSEEIGWGKFTSQNIDARKNMGWSKIAVSLGLQSLKSIINSKPPLNQALYLKQIKIVLSKGGDTDTNAAIVGGLLGSIVGFKNLPKKYLSKMMELRHGNTGHKRDRPTFYEPRVAFRNAYQLIDIWLNKK